MSKENAFSVQYGTLFADSYPALYMESSKNRFMPEAWDRLNQSGSGYDIYQLYGRPLRSRSNLTLNFQKGWNPEETEAVLDTKSLYCEVAINRTWPFLYETKGKIFHQQLADLEKYNNGVEIPYAQAVIGNVADYAAIDGEVRKTGRSLFLVNLFTRCSDIGGMGTLIFGNMGYVVEDCETDRPGVSNVVIYPILIPSFLHGRID